MDSTGAFAARLLFSEGCGPSARLHLLEHERERCERRLRTVLRKRRTLCPHTPDAVLLGLLIDGAELEVRARMAWLDRIAAKVQPLCADREPSAATGSTHQRVSNGARGCQPLIVSPRSQRGCSPGVTNIE
jgi:hypothetical protein